MKKKIKYKKDVKNRTGLMLFLLFTCFTLCLSVGYAALNSELKISGEANFRVQKDIRIEDVKLYETTNLALENYTSKYSKDTITLGVDLKQIDSTISYKVKVQNNGTVAMWIDSIENNTNNSNTEYVLEKIGLKELISPGEEKEFIIKIKYKDNITELPSITNLDTILKFNFIKPESTLAMGNSGASTTTFYNGPIKKEEVESIEFRPTLDVIEDAIGYWDASVYKNGTVIASYTDTDGNGLYELYIGGIGIVNAPINSASLFSNFTNLKTINFDKYFNTSNVTSMFGAFRNCNNLLNLDLSNFNTSKVTNMGGMFSGCNKITSLDLSSFDTSNVTTFSNASYGYGMFFGCSSLVTLNIFSFDTSKVTDMHGMFEGCSKLLSLDVSNFNTDKVTAMNSMFRGCSSLKELDLSNFNTSKISSMWGMFFGCSSLESLNVSSFNTSKVIDMYGVFWDCIKLTNLDVSSFDTTNVTNMAAIFNNCKSLTKLNISNFDTTKVVSISYMFKDCQSLTNLDVSQFNTSNVTNMSYMFYGCSSLTDLNLLNFNTSNVTNMTSMFYGCSSLTDLNLLNFDTSNVTNMASMFYGCSSLTDLNLLNFDTFNVTNMNGMFSGCSKITSLDLSNFNTSKVINISSAFFLCQSLTNLDLSSFDFSNVTNAELMLSNIPSNLLIYVKNESSKAFILNVRSNLSNVVIKEA